MIPGSLGHPLSASIRLFGFTSATVDRVQGYCRVDEVQTRRPGRESTEMILLGISSLVKLFVMRLP
jgi:hypothetical protein